MFDYAYGAFELDALIRYRIDRYIFSKTYSFTVTKTGVQIKLFNPGIVDSTVFYQYMLFQPFIYQYILFKPF